MSSYEHMLRIYPHHTDYGNVVWHGAYLSMLESGRQEALISSGLTQDKFRSFDLDLIIVELLMRFKKAPQVGDSVVVCTEIKKFKGVRIGWHQEIVSVDKEHSYISAEIEMIVVNPIKKSITRKLPNEFIAILSSLAK